MLLTATPVNNSLWDLYYLLAYFIRNDAVFADAGHPIAARPLRRAMAPKTRTTCRRSTSSMSSTQSPCAAPVTSSSGTTRTRPCDRRGATSRSLPRPPGASVAYDLEAVLPGFFDRFAHALDCDDGDANTSREVADAPPVSAGPLRAVAVPESRRSCRGL